MRQQSIRNRKYLDRLKKENPKKSQELKYKRYRSSAKSFIKKHLKKDDIKDFKEYIKYREQVLKGKTSA